MPSRRGGALGTRISWLALVVASSAIFLPAFTSRNKSNLTAPDLPPIEIPTWLWFSLIALLGLLLIDILCIQLRAYKWKHEECEAAEYALERGGGA